MKSTELPALKLFVIVLLSSILFSTHNIDAMTLAALLLLSLIVGISLYKFTYKTATYFLFAIILGLITSQRFDVNRIQIPKKIIPEQKAIFTGEVTSILKSNNKFTRYIALGNLNSQELPEIKNTKILLTVFNPKFALYPGEQFKADVNLTFMEAKLPGEQFDYETYYNSNEIQWVASCSGTKMAKYDGVNSIRFYSHYLRLKVTKKIFTLFDSTSASIINALITGDKTMIDSETKRNYSLTGTAHLLAVSGLHVGLISFAIFTFFSFVSNQWVKTFIVIILLFLFVYITGWLDSALRAAIMISVYLLSNNFEQRVNPINSLSLAALVMFLINPDVIYSVSFRMSILAVSGIIIFYRKFNSTFNIITKNAQGINFIKSSLSLTLASTVFISPLVAYYFGVFSIISPIANLFVVPITMLAMSFAIFALLLSFLSNGVSLYYSEASSFLLNIADTLNEIFVSVNFAFVEGQISFIVAIMSSFIIIYVLFAENHRNRVFRVIVSFCAAILVFLNVDEAKSEKVYTIARQHITTVIIENENKKYILLFDRMPANSTRQDFGVRNYILNSNKDISVAYTGNTGIATIDAIKKIKKFDYYEINNEIQIKLTKLLNLEVHPIKTIELK